MSDKRVGIWFIGACGGVASTAALGLAALKQGQCDAVGLVTASPALSSLELDSWESFVVGGHDIRNADLVASVGELHERSGLFSESVLEATREELAAWSAEIRSGTVANAGETIGALADRPEVQRDASPRSSIQKIQEDLRSFAARNQLEQVVVINVASTEPPFATSEVHQSLERLEQALDSDPTVLPASSLYAYAAIDLGMAYVNFTPSLGASIPALVELARERGTVVAGQDGKTGETLLKTVLAPMFKHRNLEVLSWVGHNIFGNRDGLVLDNPINKQSKLQTKDQVLAEILGYKPQSLVSIEYIQSLDDWKTAWDHIHFRGFLGTKMVMQFIWQGCDSILAAPLVLDLARLALFARRRGEIGVLRHLACFFKNPQGVEDHDFFSQMSMLLHYVSEATSAGR